MEGAQPNDPFLKYAIAMEYIAVGENEDAHTLFNELLEKFPDYVATYYHAAKMKAQNNQVHEAITLLRKGIEVAEKAADKHAANELRAALMDLED